MLNGQNRDEAKNIILNILLKKDKEINNFFKNSKVDYSKPENFIKINIIIKKILNKIMTYIIPNLSKKEDKNAIVFVYENYRYLASNIENLCEKKEGDICCLTDKSRHIISVYLDYLLTGKIPKFEPTSNTYWIPSFGTYKKWIEFCEGLYEFYYGNQEKYIKIYNELISEDRRLYKHLKHQWYIQFKDGKIIKGIVCFDNNINNPYKNNYFDKGTYYLLDGNFDKRYYENEYDNITETNKFKIPKKDIEKIFKKTYEIFI